jgi:hypothetical protein
MCQAGYAPELPLPIAGAEHHEKTVISGDWLVARRLRSTVFPWFSTPV